MKKNIFSDLSQTAGELAADSARLKGEIEARVAAGLLRKESDLAGLSSLWGLNCRRGEGRGMSIFRSLTNRHFHSNFIENGFSLD